MRRTALCAALALAIVLQAVAFAAPAAPKFVIGAQYSDVGEGEYVVQQMKSEGGDYFEVALPQGRTLHVLDSKAYPGVRIVYTGTRAGMENASQASVIMAMLPEEFRPDVVLHSGLAGNAGDGSIGDIYLNRYFVLANLGTRYQVTFEPRPSATYDPALNDVTEIVYFPADERLIEIGKIAFERYKQDPEIAALEAGLRPEGQPLLLLTEYVGASSNWFVASSDVVETWKLLYSVRPPEHAIDYPGEKFYRTVQKTLPLGTVDMESAAAAKAFFEFGIPFAAARFPVDSARELAVEQMDLYWAHAARIGGGFMWEWIKAVAEYISDPNNPLW